MFFIGDVHGKYSQYKAILKQLPGPSIQVGDMGVGFRRIGGHRDGEFFQNPPYDRMVEGGHKFIRGNHDNPEVCRKHPQCIQDGATEDGVMFIGGGVSIDKMYRKEGYSWWADEEPSQEDLEKMILEYACNKPHTMVTHDCPESIALSIVNGLLLPAYRKEKLDFPSRCRSAFERMLAIHKPKLWIFGHWHKSIDSIIEGTRFVCLAELECKDLAVHQP